MISPPLFDLMARNLVNIKAQIDVLSGQVDTALNALELLRPMVDPDAGQPQKEETGSKATKVFGGERSLISPDVAAAQATRQQESYISRGTTDKDAVARKSKNRIPLGEFHNG